MFNTDMDNGSWLWIIVVFALLFGWGGLGGNGNANGATQNYVLASDFASLQRQISDVANSNERKLDGITNGVCELGYTQAQLINGIQNNLVTQGYETRNAIQADTISNIQGMNALQAQLASCCCENREAISNSTRSIVDTSNANTRAILEALNAQAIALKDEKIADLTAKVNQLSLSASQCAQNSYLISQLRPSPIPAYTVNNPYYFGSGTTFA